LEARLAFLGFSKIMFSYDDCPLDFLFILEIENIVLLNRIQASLAYSVANIDYGIRRRLTIGRTMTGELKKRSRAMVRTAQSKTELKTLNRNWKNCREAVILRIVTCEEPAKTAPVVEM
jgi:hypothetical protein